MNIVNTYVFDAKNNEELKREQARAGEGNKAWLKRVTGGDDSRGLILIGGNSVVDFHIRVSQSSLRHDLTPSYWSMVGILSDAETFYSVPLQWTGDLSEMPHSNGIQVCKIDDYNDPARFPNIAFIRFTADMAKIIGHAKNLRWQRSLVDLPELVVRWLEYVWMAGASSNPLAEAKGLPSAVFAETAFGVGGIELTPGLATAAACPEAIWQAAKWWSTFYAGASDMKVRSRAAPMVPRGSFALRQPSAAVFEKAYEPKTAGGRKSRTKS